MFDFSPAFRAVFTTLLIMLALLAMMYVGPAESQGNWIRCRHNATGAEQMFPGMSCPNNWHPI